MDGTIYITGQIGTFDNIKGVELVDVIKQVQANKDAQSYNVYINSEGGCADTGFDIYNYLISLGKPINTIGYGMVASIATVIFMAGSTRNLRANTEFMIHMPSGGISGTSAEIEAYNEMLKQYDKKLISFYTKATGLSEEAITPLLRNETFLSLEDAFAMNFTTAQNYEMPMVAKAKYNFNTDTQMTKEDKDWIEKLFSPVAKFFKSKILNLSVTDADGVVIEFKDLADDAQPQVGDMATVNGEPANGEYMLPTGEKMVFENGALKEVIPAEADASAELKALQDENASLKEQIATMQATKDALDVDFQNLIKEITNIKKQVTSKLDIETKEEKKEEETVVSSAQERLKKINKKIA